MLLIYFFILLSSMYVFSSKKKHLLMTLLSIEWGVLGVYMIFFYSFSHLYFFASLLFLVFGVCEGVLGLSILVAMSRVYGSDYFKVFNFM